MSTGWKLLQKANQTLWIFKLTWPHNSEHCLCEPLLSAAETYLHSTIAYDAEHGKPAFRYQSSESTPMHGMSSKACQW